MQPSRAVSEGVGEHLGPPGVAVANRLDQRGH